MAPAGRTPYIWRLAGQCLPDDAMETGRHPEGRSEIWRDLPLDRTIQRIQEFRTVVSERIHPLLCTLTSAERVAYTEQRDDGSGKPSGKFRSMLIDIFGRTWPESTLFEFPRDVLAAYRARTLRLMAGMPEVFSRLLEVDGRRVEAPGHVVPAPPRQSDGNLLSACA